MTPTGLWGRGRAGVSKPDGQCRDTTRVLVGTGARAAPPDRCAGAPEDPPHTGTSPKPRAGAGNAAGGGDDAAPPRATARGTSTSLGTAGPSPPGLWKPLGGHLGWGRLMAHWGLSPGALPADLSHTPVVCRPGPWEEPVQTPALKTRTLTHRRVLMTSAHVETKALLDPALPRAWSRPRVPLRTGLHPGHRARLPQPPAPPRPPCPLCIVKNLFPLGPSVTVMQPTPRKAKRKRPSVTAPTKKCAIGV